jgi:hypothetical protein
MGPAGRRRVNIILHLKYYNDVARLGQLIVDPGKTDCGDFSHLHAPEFNGRSDGQTGDIADDVGFKQSGRLKITARAEGKHANDQDNQPGQCEQAKFKIVRSPVHGIQLGCAACIASGSRLKNWRTRGSGECSRSSSGLPSAMIVRLRVPSMIQRSAIL